MQNNPTQTIEQSIKHLYSIAATDLDRQAVAEIQTLITQARIEELENVVVYGEREDYVINRINKLKEVKCPQQQRI